MSPYTYLIGWSGLDRWYYGVRHSEKADPTELWKTYFTSSNVVKQFCEENGEPDVVIVRKVFADADKARTWEHRVLQRLNVRGSDRWLNQCDNLFPFNSTNKAYMKTPEYRKKISEANKGRVPWNKGRTGVQKFGPRSAESIEKSRAGHLGSKRSEATKRNISAALKGKPQSAESNEKRRQTMLSKRG